MPLLGETIWGVEKREKHWSFLSDRSSFVLAENLLGGEETRLAPKATLLLRISVLLRTYQGDYHTDAFDLDRLSETIRSGVERIFFWGTAAAIQEAKTMLASSELELEKILEDHQLLLGTATLIDYSPKQNLQWVELTRTGSVARSVASTIANIQELRQLFASYPRDNQVIFSTPRNRKSTAQIRGGAAIHRQHVRELNSAFWGWAPWYIMQGGFLEVLDYREIYQKPQCFFTWLTQQSPLYFHSASAADLAAQLFRLNIPADQARPECRLKMGAPTPLKGKWQSTPVKSKSLIPFNPIFIRPSMLPDTGESLEHWLPYATTEGYACTLVELDLEQEETVSVQAYLEEQGFSFVCLRFYPSPTDFTSFKLKGQWARLKPDQTLAQPYYLDAKGFHTEEQTLLAQLQQLWDQLTKAAQSTITT